MKASENKRERNSHRSAGNAEASTHRGPAEAAPQHLTSAERRLSADRVAVTL